MSDVPVATPLGMQPRECTEHGPFQSRGMRINIGKAAGNERWTSCPACAADAQAAEQRALAAIEAADKAARIAEQLGQTAIPERFLGRTLETFIAETPEQIRARDTVRYYVANFDSMRERGMGLILSGQPGTGKSHLAAAVLQAILPYHVGIYTTFMGMMHMIRSTYDSGSKMSERDVIAKLSKVVLLVIDEVGVQRGTEDEHLQLFGIIDARYAARLPTIILTNQDNAGFQRFVGDRIYDRLKESTRWVQFNWPSHRKAGGAS